MSQIVEASESTTGSLYHFFPGGKDELTAEVLRSSGQAYGELVELLIRSATDPATGMDDAFQGAAELLTDTDFIDPCPIGTVAREVASTHEDLRQVASEVMENWVLLLMAIFTDAGIEPDRARPLATLCVATIEGGFISARTHRSVEPFLSTGELLRDAIARELRV